MTIGFGANRYANRPVPRLATQAYKTYRIMSPLSTHYRPATCAEVECKAYTEGWTYKKADLDERLLYLVTHAGKHYREMWSDPILLDAEGKPYHPSPGGALYLVFAPGQSCFQAPTHRVSLERPAFFVAGRGDYRSFSLRRAEKLSADNWVDSFANHQDHLKTFVERG